jgi:hypothetical protein
MSFKVHSNRENSSSFTLMRHLSNEKVEKDKSVLMKFVQKLIAHRITYKVH